MLFRELCNKYLGLKQSVVSFLRCGSLDPAPERMALRIIEITAFDNWLATALLSSKQNGTAH